MNRYRMWGQRALVVVVGLFAFAGPALAEQDADKGLPSEQRVAATKRLGTAQPAGWPEAVPLPEGAQIDGYRCVGRHCTMWFGLMTLDEAMALKRGYIKLLRDSGKWELLGTDEQYEANAFRYTGKTESGCGYTLEIKQGSIPNDYHHRWRVSTSLTW